MNKIVEVQSDNPELIQDFLKHAGTSLEQFRYFENRDFNVLKQHLYTVVLFDTYNSFPIGYGHLDKEKNTIWLGIAVKDTEKGKGHGKRIMKVLLRKAKDLKLNEISLTVDKDNGVAALLYEKLGFQKVEEASYYYKYKLLI